MKKINKVFLTTLLAASVATASTAQAEGFFNNIFGSSAKSGAGFETLLSHVPADTSYLLTNKNHLPDEVLSFHLARAKKMVKMFTDLGEKNKDKKEKKDKAEKPLDKFVAALLEDLGEKLEKDKLEETGLSLKLTTMVYGLDTKPVVRMTIASQEKLMATIKRAEDKSKYKVEFSKCGEFNCLVDDVKNGQSVALVILKDHLAASLFATADKDKVLAHLTGANNPKDAYTAKSWDSFLKENSYKGYGEGFVNLKKLVDSAKPDVEKKLGKGCVAVLDAHIDNVPQIIMGTKNLDLKQMGYEMVVKTSSDVSSVLQTIANPMNIAKRIDNPIFDLGININFKKLRDGLTQYSNFLIKSGQENKCAAIKAKDIRKSMGGMSMAMNMGLTQFKSIYFAISDVDLGKQKADAYLSVGTDDPSGLLGMVAMLSPKLMGFQVPTDGSTVKLPKGAIPSKGMPIPPVYMSRTDKSLNVMVGNDKPSLVDYKKTSPEILSFGMDGKRYYQELAKIMDTLPSKGKSEDKKDYAKIMNTTGEMMGIYDQQISADKRGLVFSYQIHYK